MDEQPISNCPVNPKPKKNSPAMLLVDEKPINSMLPCVVTTKVPLPTLGGLVLSIAFMYWLISVLLTFLKLTLGFCHFAGRNWHKPVFAAPVITGFYRGFNRPPAETANPGQST